MQRRRQSPVQVETTEPHLCGINLRLAILRSLPFFLDLSDKKLREVNQQFVEKGFEAGETLYFAGDPVGMLYVLAEGRVKLLRHTSAGKDVLLDLLTPGDYFGALAEPSGQSSPDTAQALTPVCALVISSNAFREILAAFPGIALRVLDAVSERLHVAQETIRQLSAESAETRIAFTLLRLADKIGMLQEVGLLIQTPLGRNDLAEMTGLTPETTSRVLSQFKRTGWINTGRQWIAVQDTAALRSLVEEA